MYQHRRRDSTASAAPSSPGAGRVRPRAAQAVQKASGAKAAHRSVYALAPRAINAHRRNTALRKCSKHPGPPRKPRQYANSAAARASILRASNTAA